MNGRTWQCVCVLLLWIVGPVSAQDRRPLREATSDNSRFTLRIQPGHPRNTRSDACRATLLESGGKQQRNRRVWRAKLANEVAPCHVLIRDDGRFTVTLDEFGRGGAAHALVVYDQRGKQLREFDLRELLQDDDWKHVQVERRAVEWLPGATFTFVDQPPQFVVKLEWKREIRIDLETVSVDGATPNARQPIGGPGAAIPPEILALLDQPGAAPDSQNALSEQESAEAARRTMEALQQVAEALGLDAGGIEEVDAANANAANADPASTQSASAAAASTDANAGSDTGATQVTEAARVGDGDSPSNAEATSSATQPNQAESDPDSMAQESEPLYAGNSAESGWPIPMPDPASPVDYIAWVQEQTVTEGPSALPIFEAAEAAQVKWVGDEALYDSALRGDPAALASPEIAEWLEANRDAIANFHAAIGYEYRGHVITTNADMVVEILLPTLSNKRDLARTAIIEAKSLEARGDLHGAVNNYANNLAVGAQVSQGPTLIENLVGIAIQYQTADSLLDSLASSNDATVDYGQIAQELESKYQPTRPMAEVLQGERVSGLDIIQRLYEWDPQSREYRVSEEGFDATCRMFDDFLSGTPIPSDRATVRASLETVGFKNMVAEANRMYDRLTETARIPYPQRKAVWYEFETEISSPEYAQRQPLMTAMLPSLGRASHIATRADAAHNATRLVANLKAYRQEHGTYPESLDVFGDSSMIVDPFTSDRFVYRRTGDDFTLYSLGGNGVDDGGVHDPRADSNDVVYWPRAPQR